jgi:tetratricopeptide (TPR) repeat protein
MQLRLFVISTMLFVAACNPAKKLVKQAEQYESQQMVDEAATYYYNALLSQPGNQKAMTGLKENGQKVLNAKFATFSRLVIQNKIPESVKQYQFAEQYAGNARQVGVVLDWPAEYEEVYNDIKSEYANKLFDEALVFINQKKYDEAEKQLELIGSLDTSYAGISVLRINTLLEAMYRNADKLTQQKKYKEAIVAWTRLLQMDENYKDAAQQKAYAMEKATRKVGIFPILSQELNVENFYTAINAQLSKSVTSFTRFVNPIELKQGLENKGWGTKLTMEQAIEAAQSMDMNYFVWIQLVSAKDSFEKVESAPREAYEAYSENVLNPYTGTYTYITRFKKVQFTDTYQAIRLQYLFKYAIVDVLNQKVLSMDDVLIKKEDEAHQFSYTGNPSNLYRNLPIGNHMPPEDTGWREQFLKAKRKLIPIETLEKEAQKELAFRIAFAVNKILN